MPNPKINYPSARCLHIVSNIEHLDEQTAIKVCEEKLDKRQLLTYGLCIHDKDQYTEEEIERLNENRNREQMHLYLQYAPEDTHIAEETWTPSPEAWNRAREESLKKFPERKVGEIKPPHIHIVLVFSSARKVDEIARWFSIEPCFVETKTGRGAALYALRYLTHNHKGNEKENKHVYPTAIVHFRSVVPEYEGLAYEALLEAVEQKEELYDKYNVSKEAVNDYVNKIVSNAPRIEKDGSKGVYCRQSFIEDYTYAVYLRNQKIIDEAECARDIPAPPERQVYYIGTTLDEDNKVQMGGVGKSVFAKQVARDIAIEFYGASPDIDFNKQNPYIFYAGKSGAIFQRYTNQPIVVMDEVSPMSLRKCLDGYEGVKTFLDPHPIPEPLDIKFGDVIVTARFIIMSGISNMKDFISSLAGAYTDKRGNEHEADSEYMEQYERRIWAYVAFNGPDNYSLYLNKANFNFGKKAGFIGMGTYCCDFKGVLRTDKYVFDKLLKNKLLSQSVYPLFKWIVQHEETVQKAQMLTCEDFDSDDFLQMQFAKLGQPYSEPVYTTCPETIEEPDEWPEYPGDEDTDGSESRESPKPTGDEDNDDSEAYDTEWLDDTELPF